MKTALQPKPAPVACPVVRGLLRGVRKALAHGCACRCHDCRRIDRALLKAVEDALRVLDGEGNHERE